VVLRALRIGGLIAVLPSTVLAVVWWNSFPLPQGLLTSFLQLLLPLPALWVASALVRKVYLWFEEEFARRIWRGARKFFASLVAVYMIALTGWHVHRWWHFYADFSFSIIVLLTLAALTVALGLAVGAVPSLCAQDSSATAEPWVLVGGIAAGLAAQLPAGLLAGAWLLALHALAPRLARPLGWGAYLLALGISVLGPVARVPQWVLDLSPFTHVPHLPVLEAGTAGASGGARLLLGPGGPWVGPGVCLVLAVVLLLVAGAAGNRRDLTA